jgi:translocation and assembly module TamB
MARARRILALTARSVATVAALVLLAALLIEGLIATANTARGRDALAWAVAQATGGQVRLSGIEGRFPEAPRIGRIEVSDAQGTWLTIEALSLDWSPRRLLAREVAVAELSAARVAVTREPAGASQSTGSGGGFALPVRIVLGRLHVGRLELGAPVLGQAAVFALDGMARLDAADRGQAELALRRLDGDGTYRLAARLDGGAVSADLTAREPEDGPVSVLAGLPGVMLDARLDGPRAGAAARIVLETGGLRLEANGPVDLDRQRADLAVDASAAEGATLVADSGLYGTARLALHAGLTGERIHLEADGTLDLAGEGSPLPGLLGKDALIGATVELNGPDIAVSRLELSGRVGTLAAHGGLTADRLVADWKLALPALAALEPTLSGALNAEGHVVGTLDDMTTAIDLTGTVSAAGVAGGPLTARIVASGLPNAPSGRVEATGELLGAPLALGVALTRAADGTLHAGIEHADWRGAHAEGALTLPPGATVPLGKLDLRIERLEELRPLLDLPLTGAVTASLDSGGQGARLTVEARRAGLVGSAMVGRATISASIADPAHPRADIRLTADDIQAAGLTDPARLSAAAAVDIAARQANLSVFDVVWKGETLRLLAPLNVGFADGVTLGGLRLGLRQAVLEANGRVAPTLDLTARLRGLTPDIAAIFAPGLAADGVMQADATLSGPPARPTGTLRLEGAGLHVRGGAGAGLPAAHLLASAALSGGTARIDASLTAGSTHLTANGLVPLDPAGPLDVHAGGSADLAMLDPLLAPDGRRVGGRAVLDARLTGRLDDPRLAGTLRLSDGSVRDDVAGISVTGIGATLQADGESIRIEQLAGKAGAGRIDVTGHVDVLAPGMPVDLAIVARNATPLSSDRLSATMDADLAIRGMAAGQLALSGTVALHRADIRLPDRLPASIAVLDVRIPGAPPPPPPPPEPDVALDLRIDAPRQIFVRGRGVDAELGGRLRLRGTLANPQPDGRFQMRRGQLSLASQTLSFTRGTIGFDGGHLTDPSLDFLASTTSANVTANLAIGGTVANPKITLSSSPDLPQDEVLSRLLLGRSASSLSPLELAQIASALASLTGAGSAVGDPLERVRSGLGLDRLSVGANNMLEAGTYVAPGVYLGARQGVSGTSQSVVQIDIARGLKLEATVGNGTASATGTGGSQGSGVGVVYQFEY